MLALLIVAIQCHSVPDWANCLHNVYVFMLCVNCKLDDKFG